MPSLTLVAGFTDLQLDGALVKAAMSFMQKFMASDSTAGMHVEPVKNAVDRRIRTARVTQQYRAVLFKLDATTGASQYVLAGVYNHDDAYARAGRLRLDSNPVTGLMEVRDPDAAAAPAYRRTTPPPTGGAKRVSLLKSLGYAVTDLTDEFGFDAEAAQTAFACATEEELLDLATALGDALAQDVLLGMGAQMSIVEIRAQVGLDVPVPGAAGDELSDDEIIERLQHPSARFRFTEVGDVEEMQAVLAEGDLAAWRVFLHPEQKRHVDARTSGPFRLRGGAGTGKTVVLLHRARRLALTDPSARVVLTTFTKSLAELLRRDLHTLDPGLPLAARLGAPGVYIDHVDRIASAVRSAARSGFDVAAAHVLGAARPEATPTPSSDDRWVEAVRRAAPQGLPAEVLTPAFLRTEYAYAVVAGRVTTREGYFAVRRAGRRLPLDRGMRAALWPVFESFRQLAGEDDVLTFEEIAEVGAEWLAQQPTRPADHVLVDEGQDLSPSQWHLLRALVAEGPDDLFIAEDAYQRIYGQPIVLSQLGIRIRGRSRRLTLNYRTTHENLVASLGVLADGAYLGPDDEPESTVGYRSARLGPRPRLHPAATPGDLDAFAAEVISSWIASGVPPQSIAVLVTGRAVAVRSRLAAAGVELAVLGASDDATPEGDVLPVIATMHRAKGLEFSRVLVWDASAGELPTRQARGRAAAGEGDALLRDRSLLYVAMSRARDELVVTWVGEPSPFLTRLV